MSSFFFGNWLLRLAGRRKFKVTFQGYQYWNKFVTVAKWLDVGVEWISCNEFYFWWKILFFWEKHMVTINKETKLLVKCTWSSERSYERNLQKNKLKFKKVFKKITFSFSKLIFHCLKKIFLKKVDFFLLSFTWTFRTSGTFLWII